MSNFRINTTVAEHEALKVLAKETRTTMTEIIKRAVYGEEYAAMVARYPKGDYAEYLEKWAARKIEEERRKMLARRAELCSG